MKKLPFLLALLLSAAVHAQTDSLRVLFIGNSYIYTNNLPSVLSQCAASTGRFVETASSAPGGYTLQQHWSNSTTRMWIMQGNWDYVVLQEQSQIPSFPDWQVESDCYPYAQMLNDTILKYNPCAETVYYMTWGRQNGDSQNCAGWPPVCTYEGMDDLLHERYVFMAAANQGIVAPAGATWREWRTQYPDVNLYSADGSHPNATGTYLIACAFYAALFRDNPENITFLGGQTEEVANNIQSVAKSVVYDQMNSWYIGSYDVQAVFSYLTNDAGLITGINNSTFSTSFKWLVDGNEFETSELDYTVPASGTYPVTLIAYGDCGESDTLTQDVVVTISGASVAEPDKKLLEYTYNGGWYVKSTQPIDRLSIYNTMGQLVWEAMPQAMGYTIPSQVPTKGAVLRVQTAGRNLQTVLGQ